MLTAGVVAQASYATTGLGLPAIAPAIRRDFDLTLTQTGVVLAASFFGSVPTLLIWGLVADRIGERIVMAAGLAAAAGALVWAAYASSFEMLVGALAVAGGVAAGVNSATGRAVMQWFAAEERGLALGIRQMAVPLGGALGAVALPLLEQHISLRAAFLGLAVASMVGAVVAFVLIRVEPTAEDRSTLARPLRDRRVWLICVGSTFFVTTQLSLLGFFVLFLHDHRGVSTAVAAAALAITQVFGGISRIALGRWSDRIRMRIVPLRRVGLGIAISVAALTILLNVSTWIVVPVVFAAIVDSTSWRVGFALASLCPLAGWLSLRPLSER